MVPYLGSPSLHILVDQCLVLGRDCLHGLGQDCHSSSSWSVSLCHMSMNNLPTASMQTRLRQLPETAIVKWGLNLFLCLFLNGVCRWIEQRNDKKKNEGREGNRRNQGNNERGEIDEKIIWWTGRGRKGDREVVKR